MADTLGSPQADPKPDDTAPKRSLSVTTLLQMGVRISIVVLVSALLSYLHIVDRLEKKTEDELTKYINERGQKESQIFMLAEDNHRVFAHQFIQLWHKRKDDDSQARFEQLFNSNEDGSTRLDPIYFDGVSRPDGTFSLGISGFVGPLAPIDKTEFQNRLLITYDLLNKYGDTWAHRVPNLYVAMPENVNMVYWPGVNWGQQASAELDIAQEEWYFVANKQNNPERLPVWTGVYYDQTANEWMVSLETPVDINGRHIANIGHDIFLSSLFDRVFNDRLNGTYNIIFREDGRLLAHPEWVQEMRKLAGVLSIQDLNDTKLSNLYEQLIADFNEHSQNSVVLFNEANDAYLAATRLQGPNWFFVTVYPRQLLSSAAMGAAQFVGCIGILSLIIELAMLYLVLRRKVVRPLQAMVKATTLFGQRQDQVAYHLLPQKREDEVGILARAFADSAGKIKHYTDDLERLVEQRTESLQKLAVTDPLTDLLNRRGMYERIEAERNRQKRKLRPLGYLLIDIDYFKRINDQYGHKAGDEILVQTAQRISRCIRSYDSISRWGGEEFLVLLPDCGHQELITTAEKILHTIGQVPFKVDNQVVTCTVSIGCFASLGTESHMDADHCIQLADAALYEAKSNGRNQVVVHNDQPPQQSQIEFE